MNYQPGPAFWQAHFKDCEWRNRKRKEFSKKPKAYLEGITETGEKVLGYLKFRSFLKDTNPFNYGNSKIIEPLEEYEIAHEILYERELKEAGLKELLEEGKDKLFSSLFESTKKGIKRSVARDLLRKRTPKWNRTLFPNFYSI